MQKYIDILKESWSFTWKYKFLWWFGLIIAFFSGGGTFNAPNFSGSSESDVESINNNSVSTEEIERFFENPIVWVVIAVLLVLLLMLSVLGWYLVKVARAALLESVRLEREGKKVPTFKELFAYGRTKAPRLMVFDVYAFLISMAFIVPFICLLVIGFVFPPVFILFCCLVVFLVLFYVVYGIVLSLGYRLLLLDNLSSLEAIKKGYQFLKNNLGELLVSGILAVLFSIGILFVLMISFFILLVPIVLAGLILLSVGASTPVLILVWFPLSLLGLLGLLVLIGLQAPINVLWNTYWNKVVLMLHDEKKSLDADK